MEGRESGRDWDILDQVWFGLVYLARASVRMQNLILELLHVVVERVRTSTRRDGDRLGYKSIPNRARGTRFMVHMPRCPWSLAVGGRAWCGVSWPGALLCVHKQINGAAAAGGGEEECCVLWWSRKLRVAAAPAVEG